MEKSNKRSQDRLGIKPLQDGVFFPVAMPDSELPTWYAGFLSSIKTEISVSRRRVMISANTQMMMMYYHIGKQILEYQASEGWGAKIIDRLSADIKKAYPELKGFSPRNLKYMRKFAETWQDEAIVQRSVARLSWRHNICLMEKVKEPNRRLAYALAAYKYGWSYNILEFQLEAYTLEREGQLPNNFEQSLPEMDSDMMQYLFKDPFLLDFTGADSHSREKEIEDGLSAHIEKFLLELGQGFSYVGRQVHLECGGDDFYIDMLFYHLKLRCFVVVELKAVDFNPGMMGQLVMYQNIVDRVLRHPSDAPTIGLLLVKNKNETVVRYSLESVNKPVGVASWETEITQSMAEDLKSSLPSIEDIEASLAEQKLIEKQKKYTK
ncbi:MAG: PDDEXK nuclease domain-containing protein [Paludibacteraceae bacterium]|nr:PDDEXK nuclease domain-containing protein [Paludibacteraceae bacterium]